MLYTGGDRFEFRFMVPSLVFWFLLVQLGVVVGFCYLVERARPMLAWIPTIGGLGAAFYCAWHPSTLEPEFRFGIAPLEASDAYARRRIAEGRRLGELVKRGWISEGELVAVSGAGALPYFSGLPTFDILGLTDRRVARQPLAKRGVVAHEKFATWEEIQRRRVGIFDVRNRLFSPVSAGLPARHARYFEVYSGPVRCLRVGDQYMVFATTLSDAQFRERFAKFRIEF
jgi:hypothetical protein